MSETKEKNYEKPKNGWKPCGCTHTHTHTLLLNKKINKFDIEKTTKLSILC